MEKNEYRKWVLADAFAIAELYMQDGEQISVQEIWDEMQAENDAAGFGIKEG